MSLSKPTAERLSQLARLLEQRASRQTPISSGEIEQLTGWPSHTIRKDISALTAGTDLELSTSSGYDPRRLATAIRDALGIGGESNRCCIVGLGRLGAAFLDDIGFAGSAFALAAGFDSNVNRIEMLKADFPLYPTFKMRDVIVRLDIRYAILCVPAAQAQASADKLVECGIVGIVNFTAVILSVPPGIEVENVSIIDALGALAARLAAKKNRPADNAASENARSER